MEMKYRILAKNEYKECSFIAAAAFDDYTFFTNYIPDDKKRARFIQKLIHCELSVNHGRADTIVCEKDGKIIAAATLNPPEHQKPSDLAYMMNGYLGALLTGGWKDTNAWNEMNTKNDEPSHEIKGAWYVNMFIVAPEYQGQGIGSALIQEQILPYVRKRGGKQITLVTNSERNCCFYEKNGFKCFHKQSFEYKGKNLDAWSYCMELE